MSELNSRVDSTKAPHVQPRNSQFSPKRGEGSKTIACEHSPRWIGGSKWIMGGQSSKWTEGRWKCVGLGTVKKYLTVQHQFSCRGLLDNCPLAKAFAELSAMTPDSGVADSHFVFRLIVGTAPPQFLLAPLAPLRGEGSGVRGFLYG